MEDRKMEWLKKISTMGWENGSVSRVFLINRSEFLYPEHTDKADVGMHT